MFHLQNYFSERAAHVHCTATWTPVSSPTAWVSFPQLPNLATPVSEGDGGAIGPNKLENGSWCGVKN